MSGNATDAGSTFGPALYQTPVGQTMTGVYAQSEIEWTRAFRTTFGLRTDALDRWELSLFQDDPFRGEQLRVLVQIFNQIPMALITRPEVKKLEELKGQKIAVTFGGSTYSVLLAMLSHFGLPQNFGEYLNMPGDQAKAGEI